MICSLHLKYTLFKFIMYFTNLVAHSITDIDWITGMINTV